MVFSVKGENSGTIMKKWKLNGDSGGAVAFSLWSSCRCCHSQFFHLKSQFLHHPAQR
jgi:hypothetical protein